MKQPHQPDPSPPHGRRVPEYVVEVWVSQQLKERIRRLGLITADPGQRAPQNEPSGAELEAEP
jgi:hypothetical protein